MYKNKIKIISFLLTIILCTITINTNSAQAYEVSGFYQYETNNTGVTITKYTGGEFIVSIPTKIAGKNVTMIDDRAFKDNALIEHVNIPNSVRTIGYGAFYNCDSLLKITIPNSVTTIKSGSYGSQTFGNCDNLTDVIIGDSVTKIETMCFEECPKLQNVTIGKNVTSIDDNAFYNDDGLASITIPASVKSIGASCFKECNNLNTVQLSYGLEIINYGAFYDCDNLLKIKIPNSVTTIKSGSYGSQTFGNCDNLTDVIIGDSVTKIETMCFEECPKLQNVTIGKNVISIDDNAFYNDDGLASIIIPASVKSIGASCFKECNNLNTVQLSYGLEIINYGAFYDCDNLLKITIPNSVTTIKSGSYGSQTFGGCDNLMTLQIPNSVSFIGENLVDESKNVIISGYDNSTAAQYASNNNIQLQKLTSTLAYNFSFEKNELLMMVNEKKALDYAIKPANTTDAIVWKTSDANIATVDNIGVVTAKNVGSVSIIATTTSGKKGSITIIVQKSPKFISFKTASKTLAIGQSYTQWAIIDDGSRTDVTITYKSNNPVVATVDSNGKVIAKEAGTAVITAELFNGLKITYQVTVKVAPTYVNLTPSKITLNVKRTYILKTSISIKSYTSQYTYKSSNSKVVSVDSKGKIVAYKIGTATITVTTHNGKKATCIVTVKQ